MKKKSDTKFCFFALASTGKGISGGDRIFIELARQWVKKIPLKIYTTTEGIDMCKRQKLFEKKLEIISVNKGVLPSYFLLRYFYKIYLGIRFGLSLAIDSQSSTYLYSSSEFWMDVFPCVILKIRFPKLKWIATWYQTAPNPLKGYQEKGMRNERYFVSALAYWLVQFPIKPLIKKYAYKVIVNNQDELQQFPKMNKMNKVIILIGAVPLASIKEYLSARRPLTLKYDAVFQGRFHPQKGVVELIDIWKKVVGKMPKAKLAMIGDGPLMKKVELRIRKYELGKNIKLFGYVFDGPKKYSIFAKSKIVVHPAFFDSGGMASAEAMAFGIPAVGFNLKAYKSYYPKGMVKVSAGDLKKFAKEIIHLLENEKVRNIIGNEAKRAIREKWSWKKRASEVLNHI